MVRAIQTLIAASVLAVGAYGQQMPAEYADAVKTLAKQGDFKDNVLKIEFGDRSHLEHYGGAN